MTDALGVHLNRSDHHAIEPASDSFETDGPFVVRIQNHGEGSHVHCSLSGDLASTATVVEGNPFLEPDEVVEIPVDVSTDLRPARGTLELSTGYGRESVAIGVLVREPSNVPTSPIEPDRASAPAEGGGAEEGAAERGSPERGAGSGDAASDAERGSSAAELIEDARAAVRGFLPKRDAGTGLLLGLSALAIVVAVGAWQIVEGLVVLLAVLIVLATVLGAAIALVRN